MFFEKLMGEINANVPSPSQKHCITFAAENAESSLGISHRKNQYAVTLQEGYIYCILQPSLRVPIIPA
jgi:hypothetical protein